MRIIIQRVSSASVEVEGEVVSEIKKGFLILVGVTHDDSDSDVKYIINKILKLRVFPDENGVMNRNIVEIDGDVLCVSQFTLYGDCRKGNRPSYMDAMSPEQAKKFYSEFVSKLSKSYKTVKDGIFGAQMNVSLVNDGPITILIDSRKIF